MEYIQNESLLKFVEDMTTKYGSPDKMEMANKVAVNLEKILKRKRLLVPGVQQMFIEVLFAAAAVHNLFFVEDDIPSLFKLRQVVKESEETYEQELIEAVLQTVESQLGEDSPVPMCKPSVNSPTETFALALWIAKNYTPLA